MPKVFVTRRIPDRELKRIEANCDVRVWEKAGGVPYDLLVDEARSCDGLLTMPTDRMDATLLNACPKLKVVSNHAVGFNNIDIGTASALGIAVGNTPDVVTDATADAAFALLINAARCISMGFRDVLAGRWKEWEPMDYLGQDLPGRTLGIVGMGRIGLALARRCRAGWNMTILYSDVRRNESADRDLQARHVPLDRLLAESDFISVHADLNPSTRGMFSIAEFRKMKRSAVFVNTARGPLVDHSALSEALGTNLIFSAGLDVTDPEPLPNDHPLLKLPNVVISPHVGSATMQTRNAMAEIATDNLLAGLSGRPLRAWVNADMIVHRG